MEHIDQILCKNNKRLKIKRTFFFVFCLENKYSVILLDFEIMSENQFAMFMTASQKVRRSLYKHVVVYSMLKPITISSISMQRAEQIMSQAAAKETHDQFDDDIDDDELCRVNR